MLNGKGKKIYPAGDTFEGEFKDDKLNGQSKITHPSGNTTEGEFKDDKLNGQGKMTTSKFVIKGEFKDGEPIFCCLATSNI